MPECRWPADFAALRRGEGCPDEARAGHPLETEAFHVAITPAIEPTQLEQEAAALRARLQR